MVLKCEQVSSDNMEKLFTVVPDMDLKSLMSLIRIFCENIPVGLFDDCVDEFIDWRLKNHGN